jgi:uncharacterized protein
MRLLIDGYNLMHEIGLMGRRFGPDGLRKVRHRFLNDLAAALDPAVVSQTTVVFDAAAPPEGLPGEVTHKGISVVFAVSDESADDRVERLIASHSSPKKLTVVSSDHRLQQAARRRKAKVLTSDAFWTEIKSHRRRPPALALELPPLDELKEREGPTPRESDHWLREFADLANDPETRDALGGSEVLLSDEDIQRIEREIAEEST